MLPSVAAWSEIIGDPDGVMLFAAEEALVANAVDKRRREFGTGRACARAALAKLGVTCGPILGGEGGAPLWPPGFVGSITHCAGYGAAAVSRRLDLVALGIDAEPDLPLEEGLLSVLAHSDEIAHLRELAWLRPSGPSWDRLLFCAKEAVYKAWFPLTGRWLDFDDAAITIDPVTDSFVAHLLVRGAVVDGQELTCFRGRWSARDGLLIAAVSVPVPDSNF